MRLAGFEPANRTTYSYRDGQLTESISRPESEWDSLSHALMTIYTDWKSGICPGCGRPYESHVGETPADWAGAFDYCPASEAIARDRAKRAEKDEADKAKGNRPDWNQPEDHRRWYSIPADVARQISLDQKLAKSRIQAE